MTQKQFIFSKICIFISGIISFILMFLYCFDKRYSKLIFPSDELTIILLICLLMSLVFYIVLFFVGDYYRMKKNKKIEIEILTIKTWVALISFCTSLFVMVGFLIFVTNYSYFEDLGKAVLILMCFLLVLHFYLMIEILSPCFKYNIKIIKEKMKK